VHERFKQKSTSARLNLSKKIIAVTLFIGMMIGGSGMFVLFQNFLIFENENEISLDAFIKFEENPKEKIPTTLITNELKYTLLEVNTLDFGINGEKPLEGGIFIIVELEIENLQKEEALIYGTNWFVKDSEGRIFKAKTHNAAPEDSEKKFSIVIPPSFKVTKKIGFEIPSNPQSSMELFVADKPGDAQPILFGKII